MFSIIFCQSCLTKSMIKINSMFNLLNIWINCSKTHWPQDRFASRSSQNLWSPRGGVRPDAWASLECSPRWHKCHRDLQQTDKVGKWAFPCTLYSVRVHTRTVRILSLVNILRVLCTTSSTLNTTSSIVERVLKLWEGYDSYPTSFLEELGQRNQKEQPLLRVVQLPKFRQEGCTKKMHRILVHI